MIFINPKMHTATGLSARVYGTSSEKVQTCLVAYDQTRENLKNPRYGGDVGIDQLRQESLKAFIQGIHRCSQQTRFVILLDTAEAIGIFRKILC